jgi:hypothetical protein
LGESETDVEVFLHVGRSGIDNPPPGERHELLVGQPGRKIKNKKIPQSLEEIIILIIIMITFAKRKFNLSVAS